MKKAIMEEPVIEHHITVRIEGKTLKFGKDKECLCVRRGDRIIWKLRNKAPFSVVVKSLVSPVTGCSKAARPGQAITAEVKMDAVPGLYAYAFSAFDGEEMLIEDPEIIIRPPKGGR